MVTLFLVDEKVEQLNNGSIPTHSEVYQTPRTAIPKWHIYATEGSNETANSVVALGVGLLWSICRPAELRLRPPKKAVIFRAMHFSRHISQSHSTFSLLAALKLRSRAN